MLDAGQAQEVVKSSKKDGQRRPRLKAIRRVLGGEPRLGT